MKFNPDIHHRRSIRLKNYDYSKEGAYFVTICVREKECLFGEINDGKIQINECGEIVKKCWNELPQRFTKIQFDQFVIMPNHIHAIIIINDFGNDVGVGLALPEFNALNNTEGKASLAPTINNNQKTIGDVVRVLKSISTIKINKLLNRPGIPIWQRNYYEHIIRNEVELYKISEYIINNPVNWQNDESYINILQKS